MTVVTELTVIIIMTARAVSFLTGERFQALCSMRIRALSFVFMFFIASPFLPRRFKFDFRIPESPPPRPIGSCADMAIIGTVPRTVKNASYPDFDHYAEFVFFYFSFKE